MPTGLDSLPFLVLRHATSTHGAGLAATAHAIEGSSGHFGAVHLMQLCGAIEDQVRNEQTDGINAAVNSMIAETERVRDALKAFRYNPAAL